MAWYENQSARDLMNRRPRSLLLPLVLALGLAAVETPARADDARAQATGRALFNEGMKLFNAGKYAEACPRFEASFQHYPGIGTRGKLAECYERQGLYASAYTTYREVAQLAMRGGDPAREHVASERAKALEPKLSYLTIDVPRASEVPGLLVKRNGQEIDPGKLGDAELSDPGKIVIDVTAPDRKPLHAERVLRVGERARFDVPQLEELGPPAADQAATPSLAPETYPVASESQRPWQRPTGLTVGGVGVVGLAVSAVFGLSARSTYDSAFDDGRCDRATNQCDASGQDSIDEARSKATVSTVLFAAGAALTIGGAFLFFTAPKASTSAVRVAPVTYAGGGGFVVGGSL